MTPTNLQTQSEVCTACVLHRVQLKRRHWLLDTIWGRELLKTKLRQVRPYLLVPHWRELPELEPLLEEMIDELDLRAWPRPSGLVARIRYLKTVLLAAAWIDAGYGGYDFQLPQDQPGTAGIAAPKPASRSRS